jgi:phenylacetate-coenzyme A ligase PaaK-like adenylate-forming protein
MKAQHYLFGEFSDAELTEVDVENMISRGQQMSLQEVPIREILDILDRAGRLWRNPNYSLRQEVIEALPAVVGFSPEMIERGLDELARLLDRSELHFKLRYDLGRAARLDGWVWRKGYDGYIRAVPLGVVTHVSPGNVFLGAADSLVHGLLTKNINLVKVSRGDPLFPLLFAKSLQEADSERRISHRFAIFTLPEEREQHEKILRQQSDGIVIWGGGDAVRSWSSGVGDGVKVIPYGPRFSFSLITPAHLNAVELSKLDYDGLVQDVVTWETRACGSPQLLFWPTLHEDKLPEFCEHLAESFRHWHSRLPPPSVMDFDVKVELRKEFELSRFLATRGQAKVIAGPDLAWSVQVRRWQDHRGSGLNRTLIIVPYPHLSSLLEWLRPMRTTLQSVGLAGQPRDFRKTGLALTDLGVHRITEWGQMWKPNHGSPHDGTFQLRELVRWSVIESLPCRFDAERSLQPAPPSKTRKLNRLLEYARGRSLFYQSVLPDTPLERASDMQKLPRLDPETLRQNTPPAGSDLLTGPLEGAYIFASGGSTGAPKFSFFSLEEWEDVTDILAAIYQKAGVTKGDTVANLFMAGNLWTSFLAASEALEKLGCIKLPIAGNVDATSILSYLKMFAPTVLLGLPSLLVRLAELLEENDEKLSVRTVLYGGEAMSREARLYLQEVLGASTVASAGYASVDAGPVGYQTLDLPVGHHHLLYDYQYIEFLDPETGESVPDGQVGEITVTCLRRRLMPLIRYRTGDLGRWVDSSAWVFELKGRIGERIRIGSADLYPADLAKVLDLLPGVGHIFQLVITKQGRKDHLQVRVERASRGEAVTGESVKARLLESLPEVDEAFREGWLGGLEVELVAQGTLEGVTRTGKIKAVIDLR